MIRLIKKNAVLYKEMTTDMKMPKAMIIVLIMNLCLGAVAGIFLGVIGIISFSSEVGISYRVLSWMFTLLYSMEAGMIIFLVPALTAGSISLEKERQTLDVLLTTRMTPWEIVLGKYFSNVIFVSLLIVSSLPVLSLVFIYGGFPIWNLFFLLVVLITITCFISSFGVFFSALTKSTILSVILTYISVIALIAVTVTLTTVGFSVLEITNAILYDRIDSFPYEHFLYSDGFIFSLLLNPFVTVVDALGSCIGYRISDIDFVFNGMKTIGEILPHMTQKNIFLRSWSFISIFLQLVLSFGILRLSAVLVNPLKKPKRSKKGDYGKKQ